MDPGQPTPSAVSVRYRPTRYDYISASTAAARTSTPTVALGTYLVAIGIIPLLGGDLGGLAGIAFGVSIASGLYCVPFIWWAVSRRPDLMLGEYELNANSGTIEIATATTRTQQSWTTFRRIRELPDAFFLDYGTGAAGLIPKRAFEGGSLTTFRDLASAAGKFDRSPAWRRTALGGAIGVAAAVIFVLGVSVLATALR
jgi:hypothetical protein